MAIRNILARAGGVIVAVGLLGGCELWIEPQKRAMIDIMTQVDPSA